MEKKIIGIEFRNEGEFTGRSSSIHVKITGDERFNYDGVYDARTFIALMKTDVVIISFENNCKPYWYGSNINSAFTMLYHLMSEGITEYRSPTLDTRVISLMDEAEQYQLLFNYCKLLEFDQSAISHYIYQAGIDLPDNVIDAILDNHYARKTMLTVIPYNSLDSTIYINNLNNIVTRDIIKTDCKTIKGLRRLKHVKQLKSLKRYDRELNSDVYVIDRDKLDNAISQLDVDAIVKMLIKNSSSKSIRDILTIIKDVFGDKFKWDDLDDEFMRRYYPDGLVVGNYKYVNPATAEVEKSDLICLLSPNFNMDPSKSMMVLLLESNPNRIQSLYNGIAKTILADINTMSSNSTFVDPHRYFKKNYEDTLLADKDGVLHNHMLHVMTAVVLLIDSTNTNSMYNKFNAWRTYHNIDSFIKGIEYSKEIKRLSMSSKLKK